MYLCWSLLWVASEMYVLRAASLYLLVPKRVFLLCVLGGCSRASFYARYAALTALSLLQHTTLPTE